MRKVVKLIFMFLTVFLTFSVCVLSENAFCSEIGMEEVGMGETKPEDVKSDEVEPDEVNSKEVYSDEKLGIDISNPSGERIVTKSNAPIFSKDALIFTCESKDYEQGEIFKQSEYYSFSYDKGSTYGDMIEINEGYLQLDAVSDNSDYYIRFIRKDIVKYVEKAAEGKNNTSKDENEIVSYVMYIYLSDEYHIIFDKVPPKLTEDTSVNWSSWSSLLRTAGFSAEDNGSGLSRIVVKDSAGEVLYENHDFTNDNNLRQNFEISLNKPAKDESGEKIYINICDNAGNNFDTEFNYYLDMERPTITFAGVNNNEILNRDVMLQFSAMDNINTLLTLEYEICPINKGVPGKNISGKEKPVDGKLQYNYAIKEEGKYKVTAKAIDAAGNESESIILDFRIDKTAPELSIWGFEKGADYKTRITARTTVTEDYFEDAAITIKIVKKTPRDSRTVFDERIIPDSDRYTKEYNLYEEGDYTISFCAVDAAGNESVVESNLRVDSTAPQISIKGLNEKSITKDIPQFMINVSELFFDTMIEKVILYRKNGSEIYELISEVSPQISSENTTFPLTVEEEGDYILQVIATDRTGNFDEKNVEFSYDCTSPQIGWLDSVRRCYLKMFMLPNGFAEKIRDRNAVSYEAYINTEDLKEGTVISKDGKYVLRIIAVDEAGNVSDESAEFIIDNTAPKIVVSGLGKDGNIKKGSKIRFSLYDSDDYFEEVLFDGENTCTLEKQKECEFRIDEEGTHKIKLRAIDFAGNETDKIFYVACSGNVVTGRKSEEVHLIEEAYKDAGGSKSVKVNKKINEKYLYVLSAFILGISIIGVPILLHLRRVDTDK